MQGEPFNFFSVPPIDGGNLMEGGSVPHASVGYCPILSVPPVDGGNLKEGGIVPRKMLGDREKVNLNPLPLSAIQRGNP